jgi:8-oxo-dGTP diphosphatase
MGENTIHYVVGFLFDVSLRHVVLIQKNKPDWQAGKLNGVGGKVEPIDGAVPGQPPVATMVREFKEETGLQTTAEGWHAYAQLGDTMGTWEVTFFWATAPSVTFNTVRTMTDETVKIVSLVDVLMQNNHETIEQLNFIANLNWLIQMALNGISGVDRCQYFQIFEVSYKAP